jgi:homogentisate 1,2-dioxygenase
LPAGGDPLSGRRPLLHNADLVLSVLRPDTTLPAYSVNGDADELFFIHRGGGVLRSVFGDLAFREGDYVCVPRGVLHRFLLEDVAQFWLLVECVAPVEVPAQYRNPVGQLKMDAPYTHRDFRTPLLQSPRDEGFDALVVRRGGRWHGFSYGSSPLDVVGWDGAFYPWAFSIHDFQPKVGRVHLPPTVHATFVTRGALVCSFVPRLLDFGAGAIPCPYPHASVDIDEVIFYSRGDFASRRGVGEASLSYHPAGIAHGPHPGKYEASAAAAAQHLAEGTRHATDELAVMLDCSRALRPTAVAESIEDSEYHASFVAQAPSVD